MGSRHSLIVLAIGLLLGTSWPCSGSDAQEAPDETKAPAIHGLEGHATAASQSLAEAPGGPGCAYRFDLHLDDATRIEAPPVDKQGGIVTLFAQDKARRWTPGKASSSCEVRDGVMYFIAAEPDTITSPSPLGIRSATADALRICMKVSGPTEVKLSWRAWGGETFDEDRGLWIRVPEQDTQVTYTIHTATLSRWRDLLIEQLSLTTEVPGEIQIASLHMLKRTALFSAASVGVRDHSIGQGRRPCLYAHCPARIEFTVPIPERPVFTAGLGIPSDRGAVTFRLEVVRDGIAHTLSKTTVQHITRWYPVAVDLEEYAGTSATLALVATCEKPGQIALWSNPVVRSRRSGTGPPNVLLYVVDALRADHLDTYGYSRVTAPHLTDLAARGVRFERCYSQETWTKPSVTSLATGVDALAHGLDRFGEIVPGGLPMLPEILRYAGYTTGVVSENPHTPPDAGPRRAYSEVEAPHMDMQVAFDRPKLAKRTYAAVEAFLKSHEDDFFFLYVHTMECHDIRREDDTHFIYDPPPALRSEFTGDIEPTPMDLYDASIRHADENFHRILEKLDALGLAENTLVVFTADHGEAFGEHHDAYGHFGEPYDEVARIPLILYWPGRLPAGKVVKENVQLIDIAPTLLDLLGLPEERSFQGASLRPLIEDAATDPFRNRLIFANWGGMVSAVQGHWKLLHDSSFGPGLFNLAEDPLETRDCAAVEATRFAALQAAGDAHRARQARILAEARSADSTITSLSIDPRERELLEAMGYLK